MATNPLAYYLYVLDDGKKKYLTYLPTGKMCVSDEEIAPLNLYLDENIATFAIDDPNINVEVLSYYKKKMFKNAVPEPLHKLSFEITDTDTKDGFYLKVNDGNVDRYLDINNAADTNKYQLKLAPLYTNDKYKHRQVWFFEKAVDAVYTLRDGSWKEYLHVPELLDSPVMKCFEETYKIALKKQAIGCILGAAIADAAGVPYEVFGEEQFELKRKTYTKFKSLKGGFVGYGCHKLPAGTWSDDTSMGLCVAMSMLQTGYLSKQQCMEWFASWYLNSTLSSMDYTFGIGSNVGHIIREFMKGESLESIHKVHKCLPTNGALMRNFPMACYYHRYLPDAIRATQKQTEVTHSGKSCEIAIKMSCLQTEIIWKCLNNVNRKSLKDIVVETLKPHVDAEDKIFTALWNWVFKDEITPDTPTFYVGSSFTAMCFAVQGLIVADGVEFDNYVDGLDHVLALGGDTDTNGCIYGGMAGAYYGFSGLPDMLVKKVSYSKFLQLVAISLVEGQDLVTNVLPFGKQGKGCYDDVAPLHELIKVSSVEYNFRLKQEAKYKFEQFVQNLKKGGNSGQYDWLASM